jgi:hypothetical protein
MHRPKIPCHPKANDHTRQQPTNTLGDEPPKLLAAACTAGRFRDWRSEENKAAKNWHIPPTRSTPPKADLLHFTLGHRG